MQSQTGGGGWAWCAATTELRASLRSPLGIDKFSISEDWMDFCVLMGEVLVIKEQNPRITTLQWRVVQDLCHRRG